MPHTNKATDDNNSSNVNINYPCYLSITHYINIDSSILAFTAILSLNLNYLLENVIFYFNKNNINFLLMLIQKIATACLNKQWQTLSITWEIYLISIEYLIIK